MPTTRPAVVDYTRNVYAIIDRLRADHPRLRIETCASGGGRVTWVLARTDQAWTSDNTDPVDRSLSSTATGRLPGGDHGRLGQ